MQSPELPPQDSTVKNAKFALLFFLAIPYIAFIVACLFLLSILPSASGEYNNFIQPGTLVAAIGVISFTLLLFLAIKHSVSAPHLTPAVRISSILRSLVVFTPGIVIGVATALLIGAEPQLTLERIDPKENEEIVAPYSVSFSAAPARDTLAKRNLQVVQYEWDFDGDKQADLPPSSSPEATHLYLRNGRYTAVAILTLSDNSNRVVPYTFVITKATLSYEPEPIVDQPTVFNVSHLYTPDEPIQMVEWDFGDGVVDRGLDSSLSHTYIRVGDYTVTATVTLENGTQKSFSRNIIVEPKPPLPFEISIETQPQKLISPAPFSVTFKSITDEPLQDIYWDLGDNEINGVEAKKTYRDRGEFTATLHARSENGERVSISKVVRVVPELILSDLEFTGSPKLEVNNLRIVGEQPVKVSLTPRTIEEFVDFTWEAPEASTVASTINKLEAIYRRPGEYRITLLAQHPEGRAKRYFIDVEVQPRSENVVINMSKTNGEAPLEIQFDASETFIPNEEISGFEWLFGDREDEIPQQAGAVISHTYREPDSYTITLIATTTVGNTYTAEKTLIVRPPSLKACLTASRTEGVVPMGVSYSSNCTVGIPDSYEWNFGDGTISNEANPSYAFDRPGVYKVQLKVTDKYGSVDEDFLTIIANETP